MNTLTILKDQQLSKEPAEEVTEITSEIKELCIDMCVTMKKANGIGLAAPQVGVNKRIIVVNTATYSDAHFCTFMINPEILETREEQNIKEGCLSFPGQYVKVKRAKRVTVKYMNSQGDVLIQNFQGLAAQVIQHECEHLLGITFLEKGPYKIETY